MGVSVLILGHSGSGKSTSLRNFDPGEVGVFNVASKPLPFRKHLDVVDRPNYGLIVKTIKANRLNAYVIDDANYLMAFENFARAKETGYTKFVDMASNFEAILEAANFASKDTITYFMMHPDVNDAGRMKAKTIGKMLDEKLCVEGMFPIVLLCEKGEDGFCFVTESDGLTPVKAPMGMFEETRIDNDLKSVDGIIRAYWGLSPLKGGAPDA